MPHHISLFRKCQRQWLNKKIRKSYASLLLSLVYLLPSLNIAADSTKPQDGNKPTLRVLNWSEYIDIDPELDESLPVAQRSPSLLRFAQEHNCHVEYEEYEESEVAIHAINAKNDRYDIIIFDGVHLDKNYLTTIDTTQLPNTQYFTEEILAQLETHSHYKYSMPYLYGTTGIAYRADLVPNGFTSWKDFFSKDSPSAGKTAILNDPDTLFYLLKIATDIPIESSNENDYLKAARLLKTLDNERFFHTISSEIELIQQRLLSGEITAAILYSGDTLQIQEDNPNIEYTIPQEGSEIFTDSMVIPINAKNPDLAHQFINAMLAPEQQARLASELSYGSYNQKALQLIKENNPTYFKTTTKTFPQHLMPKMFHVKTADPIADYYWDKIFR